jgi:hypothetical protein
MSRILMIMGDSGEMFEPSKNVITKHITFR